MISNVKDDKTKKTCVTKLVYRSPPTCILRKNLELNSPKHSVKNYLNVSTNALKRILILIKKMESTIVTQAQGLHVLLKGSELALSKNSPLRNIPPNDSLFYRSLLKHKTGMVPHHSTESYDQETVWLTGKDSDSRSNK